MLETLKKINPKAAVVSAPFGKIRDYTRLSLLLNDELFDDSELQRHRLLTYAK